jgi:hypothetical protein
MHYHLVKFCFGSNNNEISCKFLGYTKFILVLVVATIGGGSDLVYMSSYVPTVCMYVCMYVCGKGFSLAKLN